MEIFYECLRTLDGIDMLPRQFDPQEFWDDLLAFVEDKKVVPVVGPELYTIAVGDQETPLYRVVAERLLQKYGLQGCDANGVHPNAENQVVLRANYELLDAISALVQREKRVADLYRPVHDLLRGLLADPNIQIPSALRELAQLTDFNLFVTTTFDDLLERAIDAARPNVQVEPIAYAPNLRSDLPESWSPKYPCVFHLFGRASSSEFFAIGEEDVLEFVYSLQDLQTGKPPERMIAELRQRHLLLIGCNFADWLSRFFIRLVNQVRLSSDRIKKEFLVGDATVHDRSLTLFVERYSHSTRLYPGDAAEFVSELLRRWRERRPEGVKTSTTILEPLTASGPGLIFLSYAHEDIAAALQIRSELEDNIGASVLWFDKLSLMPGDEWGKKIPAAIKRCDFFLAVVSANTEKRGEGYFRKEWGEALERKRGIFGKFILPVVIDEVWSGKPEDYKTLPDVFYQLQFSHARAGKIGEDLRDVIKEELRNLRRRRQT